jgi:hypothetical protein
MKTALKFILLLLGAAFAGAAFVGLLGFFSSAAFVSSEIAFSLFAVVGLLLIGVNDYSRPRPIVLRRASLSPCPVMTFKPAGPKSPSELHRPECLAA